MDWPQLITAFGAGGFLASIGQILAARLSKSKHERDAGVAKEYLSLATVTADELEKRINLVAKLDKDIRALNNENYLLSKKLNSLERKRAEQMESMEARIMGLQERVDVGAEKLSEMDVRYRALWKYLIALLEQLKRHLITPVDPPEELKSDPEILRFLNIKP